MSFETSAVLSSAMASQEPVLLGKTAPSGGKEPKVKRVEQPEEPEKSRSCLAFLGGPAPSEDLSAAIELSNAGMENVPAPAALQLCSGWNDEVHQHLQAALQKVIDQNPVFTGKLVKKDGRYCVLPGFYTLKDLLFVKDGPSIFVPTRALERVTFMQEVLEPCLAADLGNGLKQLAEASPVLRMEVLTLPGGMACICLAISHSVVDGAAYHHVVQLISDALQGKAITPMKWEVTENPFGFNMLSVLALVPGLLAKLAYRKLTGFKSHPINSFVINADECAQLKKSLKGDCAFLSTNDVVTAAMAEVMPGRTTLIPKDMRKKALGSEGYLGGNCILCLEGTVAGDPAAIRKLVGMDTVVESKMVRARHDFHIVTNWNFGAHLEGAGLVHEARCPLGAFVGQALCPTAVVINVDEKTTVVNHNMDAKTLELLAKGKLLSRLVKAK